MDGVEVLLSMITTVGMGATIWYKLGKLEGKITQICERVGRVERWQDEMIDGYKRL